MELRRSSRVNCSISSEGQAREGGCNARVVAHGHHTNQCHSLIAIMLGRLEMDVDECISAYNRLIKTVFEEKAHKTPISWFGRVQSRFDSGKLKTAIEEVVKTRGYSLTEQFNNGKPRG